MLTNVCGQRASVHLKSLRVQSRIKRQAGSARDRASALRDRVDRCPSSPPPLRLQTRLYFRKKTAITTTSTYEPDSACARPPDASFRPSAARASGCPSRPGCSPWQIRGGRSRGLCDELLDSIEAPARTRSSLMNRYPNGAWRIRRQFVVDDALNAPLWQRRELGRLLARHTENLLRAIKRFLKNRASSRLSA